MDRQEALFPVLSQQQIDACRTSAWFDLFEDLSIPAKVINLADLGEDGAFRNWLDGESIFLPEDSHLVRDASGQQPPSPAESINSQIAEEGPKYHLPKLNSAIRAAIKAFGGAVFPKLNWTAPRDAAFIIPQTEGGPLYCKSPADVYLLLKSSDLVSHGIDPKRAYATGAEDQAAEASEKQIQLEIVLKKYIDVNPSREFRCFVRDDVLLGISQRDSNDYEFLQPEETRRKIQSSAAEFWEDEIRLNFDGGKSYIFDIYFSANWDTVTLIDINPYRMSTDSLLFTYEGLGAIYMASTTETPEPRSQDVDMVGPQEQILPILRLVESASSAGGSRPTYADNMMPLDVMAISEGRNMGEFKALWDEAVLRGMNDSSDEED